MTPVAEGVRTCLNGHPYIVVRGRLVLTRLKGDSKRFFDFHARQLHRLGFSPLATSLLGMCMAVGSSLLYYFSAGNRPFLWLAAALLLLSGFFDALDGSLARLYGKVAKFGGFCDSVIDKIGEMLVLSAIVLAGLCSIFWGLWAISSSILVSYTRARGESEGANMTVGVAERPERLLILFASTLAEAINVGIIVISILASVTVAQRIHRAHRELA